MAGQKLSFRNLDVASAPRLPNRPPQNTKPVGTAAPAAAAAAKKTSAPIASIGSDEDAEKGGEDLGDEDDTGDFDPDERFHPMQEDFAFEASDCSSEFEAQSASSSEESSSSSSESEDEGRSRKRKHRRGHGSSSKKSKKHRRHDPDPTPVAAAAALTPEAMQKMMAEMFGKFMAGGMPGAAPTPTAAEPVQNAKKAAKSAPAATTASVPVKAAAPAAATAAAVPTTKQRARPPPPSAEVTQPDKSSKAKGKEREVPQEPSPAGSRGTRTASALPARASKVKAEAINHEFIKAENESKPPKPAAEYRRKIFMVYENPEEAPDCSKKIVPKGPQHVTLSSLGYTPRAGGIASNPVTIRQSQTYTKGWIGAVESTRLMDQLYASVYSVVKTYGTDIASIPLEVFQRAIGLPDWRLDEMSNLLTSAFVNA